jgi:4-amino-4-deoxy-L-arabinose transferase-like glycosyltransferase
MAAEVGSSARGDDSAEVGGNRDPRQPGRARWWLRGLVWFQVGMTGLVAWAVRHETTAPVLFYAMANVGVFPCLFVLPVVGVVLARFAGLRAWQERGIWVVEAGLWFACLLAMMPAVQ